MPSSLTNLSFETSAKYSHGYGVCDPAKSYCTFYSPNNPTRPVYYNNCPAGTRNPYANNCYPNL